MNCASPMWRGREPATTMYSAGPTWTDTAVPPARSERTMPISSPALRARSRRRVASDGPADFQAAILLAVRVAVLDDYHRIAHTLADWSSLGVEVAYFDRPLKRAELPAALAGFDTLVLMRRAHRVPARGARTAPRPGARGHHRDAQCVAGHRVPAQPWRARLRHGIPAMARATSSVVSGATEPQGLPSTIELAWALIFALFKRVPYEDRAIRAGNWQDQEGIVAYSVSALPPKATSRSRSRSRLRSKTVTVAPMPIAIWAAW